MSHLSVYNTDEHKLNGRGIGFLVILVVFQA